MGYIRDRGQLCNGEAGRDGEVSQGKGRKQELGEEREKHRAEEMCPPAMQEETRTGQRWGFLWPVPPPRRCPGRLRLLLCCPHGYR